MSDMQVESINESRLERERQDLLQAIEESKIAETELKMKKINDDNAYRLE